VEAAGLRVRSDFALSRARAPADGHAAAEGVPRLGKQMYDLGEEPRRSDEPLTATTDRNRTVMNRADAIRRLGEAGHRYSDIVPMEERPVIVELLTQTLREVSNAGNDFRGLKLGQCIQKV
jgi:hypothetical protein